jgi:hypothetical protein
VKVGWFFPGIPVSSTNKTDSHNIIEILLTVAINTKNPNLLTGQILDIYIEILKYMYY